MTATDELRAQLDKRGVEWDADDEIMDDGSISQVTYWYSNDIEWSADGRDEYLAFDAVQLITPEQAIAATLGAGTCQMEPVMNYHVSKSVTAWGCVCSNCGSFHEFTHGDRWSYCPRCGAKKVDD